MTFAPNFSLAAFLQTTEYFPEDQDQMLVKLNLSYADIANAVNIREIAKYETDEVITGQQFTVSGDNQKKYFTYRKIYYFGPIATGATLNIPHGLTFANILLFTKISGTFNTDVPDSRPLPFTSAAAVTNQTSIKVDAANIVIVNGATANNITDGVVILEYIYS